VNPELENDLHHRLALLSPEDKVRGIILNGVLEIVRTLGNETMVRQCLDSVGEKKFVDFFTYPSHLHLRFVYAAADLLCERFGSFEKTLWNMGYQGGKYFLSSAPGKILMLGQGSMQRLLSVVPSAFSLANNSLQGEVKWTGPRSALFLLKHDFLPLVYTEGTLQSLDTAKVKGLRVKSRQVEPLVGEYELTWE
jgi:uncharacterized protein (TIGR02265 family)